jgi:dihydroneopterin aldolase
MVDQQACAGKADARNSHCVLDEYPAVTPGLQPAASRSLVESWLPFSQQLQCRSMTDRIRLNDMVFYGYHGVLEEERILGQRFVVDVEMRLDLAAAGRNDDLERTVNYAAVFDLVRQVVTGPPMRLIEAVAEAIAARVLAEHGLVERVEVRIRKPEVPIPGSVLGSAEIWIERSR